MEEIVKAHFKDKASWLDKRCRAIVFAIFERIEYGHLQVVEGQNIREFGDNTKQDLLTVSAKLVIHDMSVYQQLVFGGSIGAAEAFVAGKWSSPDLTAVIRIFARAQTVTDKLERYLGWFSRISNAISHRINRNTVKQAKQNIAAHYDLGNELYTRFLDDSMMYSAAIYPNQEASLAEAQQHKLSLICQRLELNANDHLLEIGTGWGSLAIYAARHYGCKVTTTTISEEQYQYAKQQIEQQGVSDKVTLLKQDYRTLTGQYNKLVSIEMIEAVGYEYLNEFFQQCQQRLAVGGKMLLQSITIADQRFDYYRNSVDFIQRYIFPGGFLPSITELAKRTQQQTSMVIESIDDIGLDYARTLADWRVNFVNNWSVIKTFNYDESFKRLWLFYFAYCEGAFLERSTSTVQIVFRK